MSTRGPFRHGPRHAAARPPRRALREERATEQHDALREGRADEGDGAGDDPEAPDDAGSRVGSTDEPTTAAPVAASAQPATASATEPIRRSLRSGTPPAEQSRVFTRTADDADMPGVAHGAEDGRLGPRHASALRRRSRVARVAIATLMSLVLFTGTAVGLMWYEIQDSIDTHDIDDLLADDRPTIEGVETPAPIDQAAGRAINVLVMGSDSRDGDANQSIGGGSSDGMRSDTTMILHISADRTRVEIVSIPRDTLVEIPSCTLPDGTTTAYQYEAMFNSAFATGGQTDDLGAAAACTIRTVQQLTGVYIDDFVIVDFAGFIDMVDAIGGVSMCIPEAINDQRASLYLEAGEQVLDGTDALGFARARYSVPGSDGSDIARIDRQQELVGAIAREVLSRNVLSDLPQLYQFLIAATSSLTTGQHIGDLWTVANLAYTLRNVRPADITFATMPFEWAGARVRPAWNAEDLWAALRADESIAVALAGEEEPTETTDPDAEATDPEIPEATEEPTTPGPVTDAQQQEERTAGLCG